MSVKPILMNTDMVRALLANRKTVTRRVVKQLCGTDIPKNPDFFVSRKTGVIYWGNGIDRQLTIDDKLVISPYLPGDILYVRETFFGYKGHFYYKADRKHEALAQLGITFKWHPSIHMPREAARIFLRATDVRVERLQDIDDNGVVAEGLEIGAPFDEIWDKLIKPADLPLYGWDANPWAWVIGFERISREEIDRSEML